MIPIVPPKSETNQEKLYKKSGSAIKQAVEESVNNWADEKLRIGKIALIAGGVAFAGYLFLDIFTKKNKKKKAIISLNNNKLTKNQKQSESWIVSSIKGYILAFLIGIAKEKLAEALSHLNNTDAHTHTNTTE